MKTAAALVAIMLPASQVLALAENTVCDEAAIHAAQAHGVPPQVMLAITRVETGRSRADSLEPWPWAINQAGKSYWFDSLEDAETFITGALNAGLSNIDIGCFQLNFRWHGKNFKSVSGMLDPWKNADYAARFLVENHRRKGNWVDAVATYHSETPANAAVYVEKIERMLERLTPSEHGHDSADLAPPRENRFPLLQQGNSTALASLVPSGPRLMPLFDPRSPFGETP